eukprot:Em0067g8a
MSVSLNGIHGARKTIAGGSHHIERATDNAGQEICWRFNFLAGATRGQSAILPTGAGFQADVESTPPRPGHALHQWPHHSTTNKLTPLYDHTFAWTPDKLEQLTGLGYPSTRPPRGIAKVAPAVRLFLCHLIDLSTTVRKLHHHISLNALARADVMWWDSFLPSRNGVAIFVEPDKTETDSLQLFTDASGSLGFGTYFNGVAGTVHHHGCCQHMGSPLDWATHPLPLRTLNQYQLHTTGLISELPSPTPTGQSCSPIYENYSIGIRISTSPSRHQGDATQHHSSTTGMGCHSQPMFYPSAFLHLIEQCGFDAAKFNTHSLRIGAASTAARAGLPSDTIQKLPETISKSPTILGVVTWATPVGIIPWDSHQTMTSISVWDTGRPNGDQCHPLVLQAQRYKAQLLHA